VLVQTYAEDHPAIQAALNHDHTGFLRLELAKRVQSGYPPYTSLALLETRHSDLGRAQHAMDIIVATLREQGAEVRGPVAAGLARLRNIHRIHALVRSGDRAILHQWLNLVDYKGFRHSLPKGVQFLIDVDPYDFA
jgi:primosomal protein N' (replication factor Y)